MTTPTPDQLTKARRNARAMFNRHNPKKPGTYGDTTQDTHAAAMKAMQAADAALDGNGVEYLKTNSRSLYYVNQGDPYEPTLAYFPHSGQFRTLPGGWGPIVEKDDARNCSYCGAAPDSRAHTCSACGHPSTYARN